MRLAGCKREAQRLARPEQVLLADHLVRRLRAQLLGERGKTRLAAVNRKFRRISREQVAQDVIPMRFPNRSRGRPDNVQPGKIIAVASHIPRQ